MYALYMHFICDHGYICMSMYKLFFFIYLHLYVFTFLINFYVVASETYNLTWVNCEMASFIHMKASSKFYHNPNQEVKFLYFPHTQLFWYRYYIIFFIIYVILAFLWILNKSEIILWFLSFICLFVCLFFNSVLFFL